MKKFRMEKFSDEKFLCGKVSIKNSKVLRKNFKIKIKLPCCKCRRMTTMWHQHKVQVQQEMERPCMLKFAPLKKVNKVDQIKILMVQTRL